MSGKPSFWSGFAEGVESVISRLPYIRRLYSVIGKLKTEKLAMEQTHNVAVATLRKKYESEVARLTAKVQQLTTNNGNLMLEIQRKKDDEYASVPPPEDEVKLVDVIYTDNVDQFVEVYTSLCAMMHDLLIDLKEQKVITDQSVLTLYMYDGSVTTLEAGLVLRELTLAPDTTLIQNIDRVYQIKVNGRCILVTGVDTPVEVRTEALLKLMANVETQSATVYRNVQ